MQNVSTGLQSSRRTIKPPRLTLDCRLHVDLPVWEVLKTPFVKLREF